LPCSLGIIPNKSPSWLGGRDNIEIALSGRSWKVALGSDRAHVLNAKARLTLNALRTLNAFWALNALLALRASFTSHAGNTLRASGTSYTGLTLHTGYPLRNLERQGCLVLVADIDHFGWEASVNRDRFSYFDGGSKARFTLGAGFTRRAGRCSAVGLNPQVTDSRRVGGHGVRHNVCGVRAATCGDGEPFSA
jgi:hypothetical protein